MASKAKVAKTQPKVFKIVDLPKLFGTSPSPQQQLYHDKKKIEWLGGQLKKAKAKAEKQSILNQLKILKSKVSHMHRKAA